MAVPKKAKQQVKQQLLIEYLVHSPDLFASCNSIINPAHFVPELIPVVTFIQEYYESYSSLPKLNQIYAETDVQLAEVVVTRDQLEYCATELEQFCRRRAVETAVLKAFDLIKDNDYGTVESMIKDAISISLDKELGVDYFKDPAEQLKKMSETPPRTSTGWPDVDEVLGGGLARTEVILVSGGSGSGKSITLANLALNLLTQPKSLTNLAKMDVLYITLEMSEELLQQRINMMCSGVSTKVWRSHKQEIIDAVTTTGKESGRFNIKRMHSGTCAREIRAYLKKYELEYGAPPDVLIVDYLDIMGADQHVSAENISQKDKLVTEQLKDIGEDYKMIIVSASQQNRAAVTAADLNHSHIAGGLTKVNTVDWWFSIITNPAMKASGEIAFKLMKARSSDATGSQTMLRWCNESLRITGIDHLEQALETDSFIKTIQARQTAKLTNNQTLDDVFDFFQEESE